VTNVTIIDGSPYEMLTHLGNYGYFEKHNIEKANIVKQKNGWKSRQ